VVGGSPQVSRLDAAGGVTVRRPDQTAKSQYAIYDLNRRVITMLGAVTLTQGTNTVNGGRLTINLDTGRAVVDGSSVGGSSGAPGTGTTQQRGGRVTGTFSVPNRN
jgi:lipopolysaccharide export system protein LptA